MRRAHARNAVTAERFFFRASVTDGPAGAARIVEMSILEILCGKDDDGFPGLIPLIDAYLAAIECDPETREVVRGYTDFIRRRASGELLTAAQWMRGIAMSHPEYGHDWGGASDERAGGGTAAGGVATWLCAAVRKQLVRDCVASSVEAVRCILKEPGKVESTRVFHKVQYFRV